MGGAKITSGGATGLYNIELVKDIAKATDRLAKIAARLALIPDYLSLMQIELTVLAYEYNTSLTALDAALSAMKIGTGLADDVVAAQKDALDKEAKYSSKQKEISLLKIEKAALEKDKVLLETLSATEARTGVWCADLTEDLSAGASVGTIEIDGEAADILVMPAGAPGLGTLQPAGAMGDAGCFYNLALFPAWQRWKPTYRQGTIKTIDYNLDTCSVCLPNVYSSQGGLKINKTGTVCSCDEGIPGGFADFAARYPNHPLVTNTSETEITLTPEVMQDLIDVQNEVQDRFKYQLDQSQYEKLENWEFMNEGGSGDCEDFALTKAQKLLNLGYGASNMSLEIGKTSSGVGHCWLVFHTDKGDYILDNRYKSVMPYERVNYADRRRQTGNSWFRPGLLLENVPIEYMT